MYEPKTFSIPTLDGISQKQIDEHIKLYEGYVKHTNTIVKQIDIWIKDGYEKNQYFIKELWRRLPFEFDGMRSHEYYFGALEGGSHPLAKDSALGKKIEERFDGFEGFTNVLKGVGTTRGSGWVIVYWDNMIKRFLVGWVDEHHIGHLSSLPILFALDCWEHAYMIDHLPGERAKYIDAYLQNVNWETVDKWYSQVF